MSGDLILRRLREEDRFRLLEWRNQDYVREVFINSDPIDQEIHSSWFDLALVSQREFTLICQWRDQPVGVVRIESWNSEQLLGMWGCYLGEQQVPPGLGAALPLLGIAHGFDRLDARKMHAVVLEKNRNMLGIHRRLQIPEEGRFVRQLIREDGNEIDEIAFGVHKTEWQDLRSKALKLFPSSFRLELEACLDSKLVD